MHRARPLSISEEIATMRDARLHAEASKNEVRAPVEKGHVGERTDAGSKSRCFCADLPSQLAEDVANPVPESASPDPKCSDADVTKNKDEWDELGEELRRAMSDCLELDDTHVPADGNGKKRRLNSTKCPQPRRATWSVLCDEPFQSKCLLTSHSQSH